MDLSGVLLNLRKLKTNGQDKWLACCPAHEDKSPSLAIKLVNDRILLHCFAGCDTESIVSSLNLQMTDLFEGDDPYKEPRILNHMNTNLKREKLLLQVADWEREKGNKLSGHDLERELQAFSYVALYGGQKKDEVD